MPEKEIAGCGPQGIMGDATPDASRIILIDDLRSFVDGRCAEVPERARRGVNFSDATVISGSTKSGSIMTWARTTRSGRSWRSWSGPRFDGRPFDIGVITIH